ncbi:MAG: hypothetical protein ACKKL5_03085 [Candidatus Komeilibacteria bacterium]
MKSMCESMAWGMLLTITFYTALLFSYAASHGTAGAIIKNLEQYPIFAITAVWLLASIIVLIGKKLSQRIAG